LAQNNTSVSGATSAASIFNCCWQTNDAYPTLWQGDQPC
jgi:hypothetical protein